MSEEQKITRFWGVCAKKIVKNYNFNNFITVTVVSVLHYINVHVGQKLWLMIKLGVFSYELKFLKPDTADSSFLSSKRVRVVILIST